MVLKYPQRMWKKPCFQLDSPLLEWGLSLSGDAQVAFRDTGEGWI